MKNKRIAIIRPDGNPIPKGYYNSQEIGLAKGISKLGYDIDIFMSGFSKQVQKNSIETQGIGVVTVYNMPKFIIPEISQAIFPDLIAMLQKNHYDLIQVNESNDLTSFWVSRYARKNNIPCFIYQGMYEPLAGRSLALFHRFYQFFILPFFKKNIQLAVAKTNRARHYLETKGFTKTAVIPVGLDTEPFLNSESRDWYSEFNIPKDAKILLYIGILGGRRNIHFLIDIAKKLKNKGYFLLLAGKGPLLKSIKIRFINENIDNVILLGQIPQKNTKSLYEISDFFLLASNYEIYGMVVLEALYCGCPVISTKTAGPEDLIQDNVNGYLIETLDTELWKQKIEESADHFERDIISEQVKKHLTWDVIAKKYIKLFSLE